jgi:hypothetical protein
LAASLDDTEVHKGANYQEVVTVLHVNGMPQHLPERLGDVGKFLLTCGTALHLVNEGANSDLEVVRSQARKLIAESGRIYIMGFHFDDANVATIGLRDIAMKSRIFALNFDGHRGVRQRFLKLGCAEHHIVEGTADKQAFIDQAIDQGFLEQ